MKIFYQERDKTYDLTHVTEAEIQILYRAFEYDRPFSDIPELDLFSRDIRAQLEAAVDELTERYR